MHICLPCHILHIFRLTVYSMQKHSVVISKHLNIIDFIFIVIMERQSTIWGDSHQIVESFDSKQNEWSLPNSSVRAFNCKYEFRDLLGDEEKSAVNVGKHLRLIPSLLFSFIHVELITLSLAHKLFCFLFTFVCEWNGCRCWYINVENKSQVEMVSTTCTWCDFMT